MWKLFRRLTPIAPRLPRTEFIVQYSSWSECTDILLEEDRKLPPAASRTLFKSGSDALFEKRPFQRWKLFSPGQIIRPHCLTYKSRVNAPRSHPFIPPAVAPPTKVARENDIFYQLGLDPLSQAMNPSVLSHFQTELGKIMNRSRTRLTSKSQRKLAQAIKRARMMGVIPNLSRSQIARS